MSDRAMLLDTVLNARKSMTKDSSEGGYPGSQVQVPYVHNPNWSKIDPLYKPAEYTDDSVEGADADIMHTPALIMFNQVDAYCSVDRRSYTGTYTVINGLPR